MKKMIRRGVITVLISVSMLGVFVRGISLGAETLASAEQTGTALAAVPERWMTTDQSQKLGTSSSMIVTFLNTYGYPPIAHWTRDPISTNSDETAATTWLYNSIRYNVSNNSGTIAGVCTCDERLNGDGTHKKDAWGRDQRLWGWNWTPHQHFIVEYGVKLDASNRHWISYIDPWNQNSYTDPTTGQFEQTGGPTLLDAAVVAHLLIYNTGYLVHDF